MNRVTDQSIVCLMAITTVALTSQAEAMLITNTTTGEVIFDSAGYEDETVGTTPSNPAVGSYATLAARDVTTDAATPGAYYDGDLYVQTVREGASSGHLRHIYDAAPEVGETIRAEFALYLAEGDHRLNLGAAIAGLDGFPGTTYRGAIRFSASDSISYATSGGTFTAGSVSNIPIVRNQWQEWVIEYTRGTGSYTVSIDGSTPYSLPTITSDGGSHSYFVSLSHAGNGTMYVDSEVVPEPASLALLGLGGIAVFGRRRHR